MSRPFGRSQRLLRSQEVENVLLLRRRQRLEVFNHFVGFRSAALMVQNRREYVARPPIMQEENPLPHAPQRCRAELIPARSPLRNVIRQAIPHVMDFKVAECIDGLLVQPGCER